MDRYKEHDKNIFKLSDMSHFNAMGIKLASPEQILQWSRGEVTKAETINYRTLKPERDGLFCEKIFGPSKDWECYCGKYKKIRHRGIICDRCGVEVTKAKVRRERMGHIKLASPVSHIWYFRGTPSRIGLLLDLKIRDIEKVLYFASFIVIDPMESDFLKGEIISDNQYRDAINALGTHSFVAKMGAEAIKMMLANLDLAQMEKDLLEEMRNSKGQKRSRLIKRLEVVQSFLKSGNKPEWMILDVLPVLPPELRPLVQLDGGRFATSDLNDLYRRVINRNNRLKKFLNLGTGNIIVRNEMRMLQESVDALIDNGRHGRTVNAHSGNRAYKSLSNLLKGKQGRFRQNLLGKRVDYSGRSVIVIGPELKIHQCGLPKEMALELFKPFVMREIVNLGHANHMTAARRFVEKGSDVVWDTLEAVIEDHPVLLNRAPTLHRLGIQAFEPVLVEGRAIKLHPLVCTAYNADFDGDQMAVHVPLSAEAQAEARFLMLSSNNLLKPQDGKPVTVPTQDMVLGCYYLTMENDEAKGEGRYFTDLDEAIMAYDNKQIELHSKITVLQERDCAGEMKSGKVESTLGRFIFNEVIPQNLGFVDRSKEENWFKLEIDYLVNNKKLGNIIEASITKLGMSKTALLLDKIKTMGFHYSTIGGISIGIFDMIVPDVKKTFIDEAEEKVDYVNNMHKQGFLSEDGRYRSVVSIWRKTTDSITQALKENLGEFNPVYMMSNSGARGNINQIKQLAGMRGNMSDTSGKTIEIPIKSNLREGMNVLEFFISSHGARKALSDTALKTSDSGYLTRRLVDISQDVIIREIDCDTTDYVDVSEFALGSETSRRVVERLADRISGRFAAKDIIDPETEEVILKKDEMISPQLAEEIEAKGIQTVAIRSILACNCKSGICTKCYGNNLATGEAAVVGEAVGIMAAQSIGEPGTQLTMRTFHTGGIASTDDITQGLPRVEELFEARTPKGQATISSISGVVNINEDERKRREITVVDAEGNTASYLVPLSTQLLVAQDDIIEAGDRITEGSISPQDIMKIKGPRGVQDYIIREVLKVYKNNGVEINDKHIEIITRQMLRKVKVEDPGDTELLANSIVDMFDFIAANEDARAKDKQEASGDRILLGITKAATASDSFLSAASFQEQMRNLMDAAVKGKTDPLIGLKENVIIGKLIPAGTGLAAYRNITAVPKVEENKAVVDQ